MRKTKTKTPTTPKRTLTDSRRNPETSERTIATSITTQTT